jgi:hypothetical protein
MISTVTYPQKNILHVGFRDYVTTSEFDEFHRNLEDLLAPLSKGFILISDFSGLMEMDFACWRPIAMMMEKMVQAGVSEVIRVMEDSSKDIGCSILASFHYPHNLRVQIRDNLAEVLERFELNPQHQRAAEWTTGQGSGQKTDQHWHATA